MGLLKPGATYIYERHGGTVYAREMGAPAETRIAIGWDWEPENNLSRVRGAGHNDIMENQLWHDIRQTAKTNPALQEALDRVKVLYELSKDER
ncbi:hypothetical protein UFOVP328_314 [uncultured Caudovirales phage]|uniref:Uncharacterized protein n=1 Tax=uncultured Caudovirales phage TaxID=2100421 RepID=A0A6J5LVH7_9CAUD|nr:hypothetical protein UFOVP328_314 [uncultured Caudovirales phage]